jgi:hypothetical protein
MVVIDDDYEWLMKRGYECDENWVGERSVDAKRKC